MSWDITIKDYNDSDVHMVQRPYDGLGGKQVIKSTLKFALAWPMWRALAALGSPTAQTYLGELYNSAPGRFRDAGQAFRWFYHAAKDGLPQAQWHLGTMYEQGCGVLRNSHQAGYWYQQAAEQNLCQAQLRLGEMYAQGEGVVRNGLRAYWWHSQAANRHQHPLAYLGLSELFLDGNGVPQSDRKAAECLEKASGKGLAQAQYRLGLMYVRGQGVPQSYFKAIDLLHMAEMSGMKRASKVLKRLRKQG